MEKRRSSLQPTKEGIRQARDSVSRTEREKASDSLAGKKRKKKKRPEAKERLCDGPTVKGKMSPAPLRLIPSGVNGPSSTGSSYCSSELSDNSLRRLERVGSSSSSVENSKPATKVTRFDSQLSTEGLSIIGRSQTANPRPSHQPHTQCSVTSSTPSRHDQWNRLPVENSHATVSSDLSACTSTSPDSHTSPVNPANQEHRQKLSPTPSTHESLRWGHEFSDEEKEKDRIEVYKANRRKRYNNLLKEIAQSQPPPNPYYTPSESAP